MMLRYRKTPISFITALCVYIVINAGYWKLLFEGYGSIFSFLQIIALGGLCVIFIMNKVKRISLISIFLYFSLIAFLLWRVYEIVLGPQNNTELLNTLITIIFCMVLYNGTNSLDEDSIKTLMYLIINMNFLGVLIYLIVFWKINIAGLLSGVRLGDLAGSSIWLARFCADSALCCLLVFLRTKGTKFIIQYVLFFIVVLLTASKGPLLVLLLFSTIIVMNSIKSARGKAIVLILIVVLALVVIIGFQFIDNPAIQYRFSLETIMNSNPGYRVDRYRYSLMEIKKSPIGGNGIGNWGKEYWSQYGSNLATDKISDYPHNIYLQIAYEMGVFAIVLFSIPIIGVLAKKKDDNTRYVYVLLLSNVAYALTSGSVIDGNRGVYYWMAVSISILYVEKLRRKNEHSFTK